MQFGGKGSEADSSVALSTLENWFDPGDGGDCSPYALLILVNLCSLQSGSQIAVRQREGRPSGLGFLGTDEHVSKRCGHNSICCASASLRPEELVKPPATKLGPRSCDFHIKLQIDQQLQSSLAHPQLL